jgi:SAM-dependent methyltransferase
VGVDESPAMLALLPPGIEGISSRIEDLELPTRFGGVLLASHLLNAPDARARAAQLGAAARHLAPDGLLVESCPACRHLHGQGDRLARLVDTCPAL